MQITQNLVELLNARLKDLMFEVSLANAIELAEDMELAGVDDMKVSLLAKMEATFLKPLPDMEKMRQALEDVKNQLEVTIQLDYLANKFKTIGASEALIAEMMELKDRNLEELMRVVKVNKEEVE